MPISLRAACAISFLFVISAARAADTNTLDEVVVTAELRDRELRELPASVTVLDARTLERAGVTHFQDVISLVPNLNYSAGTSRPRFFQLRGIGELEQWQGAPNPSVGFLIDGVLGQKEAPEGDATTIVGIPGARGVVEGPVRLVRSIDDLFSLEPGDVLVTPTTGEAFNSMLHLVSAIVTDHGSFASHAAPYAR